MFNEQQFILNNEYIQFLEDGKVVYDTRWSYEDFLNGGPNKMNKDLVIKNMREAIEINKTVREKTNNALSAGIGLLEKHDGEYERGLNDAWEAAKKIALDTDVISDAISLDEIRKIFGMRWVEVLTKCSPMEVVEKIKAYEKEQEAAKPKIGDVVEVRYSNPRTDCYFIEKGVFIKETDTTHNILRNNGDVHLLDKDHIESIEKTGEHVDILGALGKE